MPNSVRHLLIPHDHLQLIYLQAKKSKKGKSADSKKVSYFIYEQRVTQPELVFGTGTG